MDHQMFGLNQILDTHNCQQTENLLAGKTFDTVCMKSMGSYGFLSHPDFEEGIYLHRSIISGQKISVGDQWRITVGTRHDQKKKRYCFVALTAKKLPSNVPSPSQKSTTKHISIYIDETWPGSQNKCYEDIGVIGGIVIPNSIKNLTLPLIPTHIQDVKKARAAIQTLLNEPEIFPFVLPIKFGQKIAPNSSIYFKLVQHAILLLLGWLLPRPNDKTSVDIFLEHISGYEDGHEETEFFKILTSALNLLANESRFSHWEINNVEWVGKDFQYVPYGDLVCKTCVPHPDKRQLASDVNLNRWPGFLPFSPTVFQILHALDSDSPAGFADHLAHLATTHKRTPLFRNVLQHAIQRAKKDVAFRDALFEKFENCYKQANRDISGLNDLVHPFLISLPVETFSGTPRILFLRVLVELQNANHNGTPEKLGCVLDNYTSLRNRMIELDRELCVDADLNLAVHYHDLFDFQRGADLANAWISDSLFPALSIASRGKLYSSLGQSLALLGHGTDADRAFVTALTFFSQEEELYEKEIDQTSVYRALNMLDFNSHAAIPLVEYTLKHPLIEIAQKPGTFLTSPFHEYLFLKTLWVLRDVDHIKTIIRTFLSQINTWPPQQPCHPYELILFYRALLLKPHNVFAAQTIALKIGALYSMMEHGDVLMLILVAIRSTLASNGIDLSAALSQILPSPSVLKTKMPCAAKYIDRLVQDSAPHDEEKSKFLPFYYT